MDCTNGLLNTKDNMDTDNTSLSHAGLLHTPPTCVHHSWLPERRTVTATVFGTVTHTASIAATVTSAGTATFTATVKQLTYYAGHVEQAILHFFITKTAPRLLQPAHIIRHPFSSYLAPLYSTTAKARERLPSPTCAGCGGGESIPFLTGALVLCLTIPSIIGQGTDTSLLPHRTSTPSLLQRT
jgi:hypothetical protein